MTDVTQVPVLERLFNGLQEELRSSLGADRMAVDHPGLKGDASETHWREMLGRHLPRRYRVAQGIVVDSAGGQSEQIDIIVHDAHYCPLFRDQAGTSFVPAESVYAVLEAKQVLNAGYLYAAAKKALSVRRLTRTTGPIVDRGVQRDPRPLSAILSGIVCLEVDWTDGLGESFRGQLARHVGDSALDLGCALSDGAFEVAEGAYPDTVKVTSSDQALVAFFMSLVRRLQALGTVPVIEWEKYERAIRV